MTSSSNIITRTLALVVLLVLPSLAWPQQSLMQRGALTVAKDDEVFDVVVADGDLSVMGRVKGSIFLVNGAARLEPGAVVEGNLTLLGGELWVKDGAAVEGEINVLAGKAHIDDGAKTTPAVTALEEVSSLTPEKLKIVSRYIVFARKSAPESFDLADLQSLAPRELRLRLRKSQSTTEIRLYELGKTPLDVARIEDSRQNDYRGNDVRVRVLVVRFKSEPGAEKFWDHLRDSYEDQVAYSVHNSLGDGAHWFFRNQETTYCLWHKERTLQAVMVRHDDNDPEADEWKHIEDLRDRTLLELYKAYDAGTDLEDKE